MKPIITPQGKVEKFSKMSEVDLKEIAALAFGHKEWITTDITVRYNPYIVEHYEDADEYFEMQFEGYFAGDNTAIYKVQLRPSMNVALYYSYKEEKNKILCVDNQNKIQTVLSKYKTSQQKGVYSEDEIEKAIKFGSGAIGIGIKTNKEFINSLKENIELETESFCESRYSYMEQENPTLHKIKTTRDSNGQLIAFIKK